MHSFAALTLPLTQEPKCESVLRKGTVLDRDLANGGS